MKKMDILDIIETDNVIKFKNFIENQKYLEELEPIYSAVIFYNAKLILNYLLNKEIYGDCSYITKALEYNHFDIFKLLNKYEYFNNYLLKYNIQDLLLICNNNNNFEAFKYIIENCYILIDNTDYEKSLTKIMIVYNFENFFIYSIEEIYKKVFYDILYHKNNDLLKIDLIKYKCNYLKDFLNKLII